MNSTPFDSIVFELIDRVSCRKKDRKGKLEEHSNLAEQRNNASRDR